MSLSPGDEVFEVTQPSLLPIPDHSVLVRGTTSDHYCVSNGVGDGTGMTVINSSTNNK